jgi:hypothetical protein
LSSLSAPSLSAKDWFFPSSASVWKNLDEVLWAFQRESSGKHAKELHVLRCVEMRGHKSGTAVTCMDVVGDRCVYSALVAGVPRLSRRPLHRRGLWWRYGVVRRVACVLGCVRIRGCPRGRRPAVGWQPAAASTLCRVSVGFTRVCTRLTVSPTLSPAPGVAAS